MADDLMSMATSLARIETHFDALQKAVEKQDGTNEKIWAEIKENQAEWRKDNKELEERLRKVETHKHQGTLDRLHDLENQEMPEHTHSYLELEDEKIDVRVMDLEAKGNVLKGSIKTWIFIICGMAGFITLMTLLIKAIMSSGGSP